MITLCSYRFYPLYESIKVFSFVIRVFYSMCRLYTHIYTIIHVYDINLPGTNGTGSRKPYIIFIIGYKLIYTWLSIMDPTDLASYVI